MNTPVHKRNLLKWMTFGALSTDFDFSSHVHGRWTHFQSKPTKNKGLLEISLNDYDVAQERGVRTCPADAGGVREL